MEVILMDWLRKEIGELLEKDEDSCLALICEKTIELPSVIESIKPEVQSGSLEGSVLRADLASRALVILSSEGLGGVRIVEFILMIEDDKAPEKEKSALPVTRAPFVQRTFVDQSNPTLTRSLELLREEFMTLAQQLQQQPSKLAEAQEILVRMMAAWAALLYQCLVHAMDL